MKFKFTEQKSTSCLVAKIKVKRLIFSFVAFLPLFCWIEPRKRYTKQISHFSFRKSFQVKLFTPSS